MKIGNINNLPWYARLGIFGGLAVLAGFGAVRFLKSSAEYSPDDVWSQNERESAERSREQTSFQGY